MPERDGFPAGVPAWVDSSQPDVDGATAFYGALFGWQFSERGGAGADARYAVATLEGKSVAAIAAPWVGGRTTPEWTTYVAVDDADAIVREMQEINFRVMISGSLLFKQTTAQIDDTLQGVIAASADLKTAIAQADKVRDIIKATSKFLGLVDKVLDRIKLL